MTTRAQAIDKAAVLTEALPYIRAYKGATVVVKIGGAALEEAEHAAAVAEDLALLSLVGIDLVIVHGGGPQVSQSMERLGLAPRFVGGLRVTDEEAMRVVQQVLIGQINKDLVAGLSASGLAAVGLSGIDGRLFEVKRTRGPAGEDIGWVGEVTSVESRLIGGLLSQGFTPVIASVAHDGTHAYNVNADVAAGAVASSLGAAKLVYLTNVEGLYSDLGDEDSLVSEMKADQLAAMLPTLSEGMRPKASSAVDALRSGVGKVHILDGRIPHALLLEIFTDEGIGTQVLA
ncbi:MAG: acetylglutamate kinase [Actinomycetota bacterium]